MACDPLVALRMQELKEMYGSWKAVAEHFGVTPAFISNINSGYSQPTMAICEELKLRRRVTKTITYERLS